MVAYTYPDWRDHATELMHRSIRAGCDAKSYQPNHVCGNDDRIRPNTLKNTVHMGSVGRYTTTYKSINGSSGRRPGTLSGQVAFSRLCQKISTVSYVCPAMSSRAKSYLSAVALLLLKVCMPNSIS
jgi:hypothetical protein